MKQRLSLLSTQSRVFIALAIVLAGLISVVISANHYFNAQASTANGVQINAGGGAAPPYVADEDFNGGRACRGTKAAIDTSEVTDAAPQAVYQTNRCGRFTYIIKLTPSASYTVRLHFAETFWNQAGKRIFNVKLNGQQVLTNFDILATAGGAKKAVAEQFTTTANASGTITIQFITVKDNALVSGIEIIGENTGQSNSQGGKTGGITPTPTTQSGSISPGNEIAWSVFDGGGQHSGVNPNETTITANNVGNLTQLWQQTLPGTADGAPVELPHVTTPLGVKDLLFVTTKAGSLIATDANTGALVWHADTSGPYITTSSPAIDPSGQFVYSYGLDGKVHKYKVGDGTEITNATWPATVTLLVNSEKGEPPINIANGYLYMTTAGHYGDGGHYEGHIIAVNLATGVETVFNALCANIQHLLGPNDCPDSQGGIWGRGAPEVDPVTGNLYVTTGNGRFDPSKHDYGDSVLELSPDLTKLLDSYTPANYQDLQNRDQDLGSASPAILPKQANSSTPYMMVQAGKDSTLRLINRQNLSGQGGPNHVGGEVQALALPQGGDVDTQPAVWTDASGTTWVFVANFNGLSAFKVVTDTQGHSTLQLAYKSGFAGSSPFIANNILFLQGNNVVRAMNPTTGAVLWSSTQPSAGNSIGSLHWQSPIVVNGHLFAEDNNGKIYAYGLKSTLTPAPTPTPIPTKPVASPSPMIDTVQIKIIDDSTSPSGFSFSPATVTITKGTKVTWVNDSAAPHTATPDNANDFTASPTLETNQSYSLVFNTAGTYTYHCVVHPQMKATIIVTG